MSSGNQTHFFEANSEFCRLASTFGVKESSEDDPFISFDTVEILVEGEKVLVKFGADLRFGIMRKCSAFSL